MPLASAVAQYLLRISVIAFSYQRDRSNAR